MGLHLNSPRQSSHTCALAPTSEEVYLFALITMIEPSPFWATLREVTSISAAVMHSLLEIESEEALQPKAPKQRDDGEALEMIPMPVFSRPYRESCIVLLLHCP